MTVNIAWGPQSYWNALSSYAKSLYSAHYLDLGLAVAALPGTPVEKWVLYGIGPTTNSSQISLPSSFNGQDLEINGGGFLFSSNYASFDLQDYVVGGKVRVVNFRYKSLVTKTQPWESFLIIRNNGIGNKEFCNNYIDCNNLQCISIYVFQFTGSLDIKKNTIINSNSSYGSIRCNVGTLNVIANTCYNNNVGLQSTGGTKSFKSNNFTGNTVGIDSTYTDLGGNATSDATGSPGFQNILATNAMRDPVNGNYTPIKDGPLLLPDGTYAGAIQPPLEKRKSSHIGVSLRI